MIEPESTAADARAREEATDPTRSIVLQAPAGSGKTTVLPARFMRLLASVDAPEEILAVTFTRKAAAAMRARIVEALGENPPASVCARAWDLANNPGRLRIQTIDSFNYWLASQLPVTAKAGGTLNVEERPQELYTRAARATLVEGEKDPQIAADVELLFERLDNRWNTVEELLAQMLQSRAHWLRHVMCDPAALRARMTASLGELIAAALARIRRSAGSSISLTSRSARSTSTLSRFSAIPSTDIGNSAPPKFLRYRRLSSRALGSMSGLATSAIVVLRRAERKGARHGGAPVGVSRPLGPDRSICSRRRRRSCESISTARCRRPPSIAT